mgnify:CR=1 FL=1
MSASEIADDVRSGRRSARDVLEEHLARVDEHEGEIHAFNLVLADEARAAADSVDAAVGAGGFDYILPLSGGNAVDIDAPDGWNDDADGDEDEHDGPTIEGFAEDAHDVEDKERVI